jgi:putative transposase
MITLLLHLLRILPFLLGGHRHLAFENFALRQQLAIYKRTAPRPSLRTMDRLFWVGLARAWPGWRQALVIVSPDTVLRWQRRRFREYWAQLSGRPTRGRPCINAEIVALVRKMAAANPYWGCASHPRRAPQAWHRHRRAYRLPTHAEAPPPALSDLAGVPRQPHRRLGLHRLLHRAHRAPSGPVRSRRPRSPPPRVVHFIVTEHPTAQWTANQIVNTFPDDSAPVYRLRDRDRVYGQQFRHCVNGMGIAEVLTAPHSPWQNPFAERLIGSIRRECLNHVLVLSERHLRRLLTAYFAYYHRARTHLSLDKDAPNGRPIEPPELGAIIQIPEVGGLHHRYVRRAA